MVSEVHINVQNSEHRVQGRGAKHGDPTVYPHPIITINHELLDCIEIPEMTMRLINRSGQQPKLKC